MSKRETYTTMVVSTTHVTKGDADIFLRDAKITGLGIESGVYSWRVYCGGDGIEQKIEEFRALGLSEQTLKLMQEANGEGHRWLEFDRDGEIYDDLQKFNW